MRISRKSPERLEREKKYKAWASAVKDRDGWKCVVCGELFAPNAHHILPREVVEFRFEVDNGVSLCVLHHKFSRLLSAHNNPVAFLEWLKEFKPDLWFKATRRGQKLVIMEKRCREV